MESKSYLCYSLAMNCTYIDLQLAIYRTGNLRPILCVMPHDAHRKSNCHPHSPTPDVSAILPSKIDDTWV
jgi:hypothetical protein